MVQPKTINKEETLSSCFQCVNARRKVDVLLFARTTLFECVCLQDDRSDSHFL